MCLIVDVYARKERGWACEDEEGQCGVQIAVEVRNDSKSGQTSLSHVSFVEQMQQETEETDARQWTARRVNNVVGASGRQWSALANITYTFGHSVGKKLDDEGCKGKRKRTGGTPVE